MNSVQLEYLRLRGLSVIDCTNSSDSMDCNDVFLAAVYEERKIVEKFSGRENENHFSPCRFM
jgi:hypothetical protein